MIVDTSAIVAILRDEPERPAILAALAGATVVRMSAGTRLELAIVIRRLEDPVVERRVEDLLEALRMSVEPFTVAHGERIAQLVVAPVVQAGFTAAEALSHTARGAGGFGSTGQG